MCCYETYENLPWKVFKSLYKFEPKDIFKWWGLFIYLFYSFICLLGSPYKNNKDNFRVVCSSFQRYSPFWFKTWKYIDWWWGKFEDLFEFINILYYLLADYGESRFFSKTTQTKTKTKGIGTYMYMAPELISEEEGSIHL
jgi:hypothetical protein